MNSVQRNAESRHGACNALQQQDISISHPRITTPRLLATKGVVRERWEGCRTDVYSLNRVLLLGL